jgi:hypothetical protein
MNTSPSTATFAEARETALDLMITAGVADAHDLAGAIGAAAQRHELAIEAAERHPGAEWLYQRAIGASDVIAAMAAHLAA